VDAQLFDTGCVSVVGYAYVAPEQGIDSAPEGLVYGIPESLSSISLGDRVQVPLGRGNRPVAGHVLEVIEHCPLKNPARVKAILSRDPQGISLTADLVELARWMASYYCCPLGMVFSTMLPAAVKRGTGTVKQQMVTLAKTSPDHSQSQSSQPGVPGVDRSGFKLTRLQNRVLDAVESLADQGQLPVTIRQLANLAGAKTVTPIKVLIDKGVLALQHQTTVRASSDALEYDPLPSAHEQQLTDAQRTAIQHVADQVHQGFSVHLLHGVTGSGKTEVYLRIIEHLLAHDTAPGAKHRGSETANSPELTPGAIVLVPEIALTSQTIARFIGRFDSVAVLHSGLTGAQRHEQWQRIRQGRAKIVVGARSAVFAPLPRVGIIIIDEEHDTSYKQDQLPRYHARDVAIKRAQVLGVPVVLGSATPSLESYFRATVRTSDQFGYHLLQLPERVAGLSLPKVQVVDLKAQRRASRGVQLISQPLELALGETLRAKGQAMLLLNRRGYANYIACPDHRCGWLMNCKYCDAMMVYHKDHRLPAGGLVRCHHCHAEQLLAATCPHCSKKVTVFGLGTQRVEEQIADLFPNIRMLRMDSDTMRTAQDYHQGLDAFRQGELDLLVGTQMIAKGLDFPNVRVVGVISADTSLHMPDFRAAERTFQLVAQVAGRAGRGNHGQISQVIVQSFNPDDPAIVLASQHDYEGFAKREMGLRQQVGLPPYSRMARIVVRNQDYEACIEQAKKVAAALYRFNADLDDAVRLRGPMPCPIARIAGYHRQQIELIGPIRGAVLQKLLTAARNARMLHSDAYTAIDVDPVSLL